METADNQLNKFQVSEDSVRRYLKQNEIDGDLQHQYENVYFYENQELLLFKLGEELAVQNGKEYVQLSEFIANRLDYRLALDESNIFQQCENILPARR